MRNENTDMSREYFLTIIKAEETGLNHIHTECEGKETTQNLANDTEYKNCR